MKELEFDADGRHYTCTVTERKGAGAWWWFTVSKDMQSYAPFQALPTDTAESVEERIVTYYTNRLFQLSQPSQRGSHWANRGRPAAVAVAPAPAPAVEAEPAE